jgi:hypothetical protein
MALGLVAVPVLAGAQVTCDDCYIGIYDDLALNKNFGAVTPFTEKEIYVAVHLGSGETGVTGLEFSVSGMRQAEDGVLVSEVSGITDPAPNLIIGTIQAPVDTLTGSGGMNVSWPVCIPITGSAPLLKIKFITFGPVVNKVFQVHKRFPPPNPTYQTQLFTRCDAPNYTLVGAKGQCYVAGYDGTTPSPGGCPTITPVEGQTWTGMKQLFR